MNCPDCDVLLRANAKSCKCGWRESAAGNSASGQKAIPFAVCFGCGRSLPWPSHKQEKSDHRIIGRTRGNQPVCNRCYEKGEGFDWRDKAAQDFAERHRNDEWGMLLSAAYNLHGSPKSDWVDFMAILKAKARASGGLTKKLPYDPSLRESA